MLLKGADTGISFHMGPFISEENLETGGGLICWGLSRMNEGGPWEQGICLKGDYMRGVWIEGSFR
jgi:hypothetical protein